MADSPRVILHLCEHFGGTEASLHGVARSFQWWFPLFDSSRFRMLLCSRKGPDKAHAEMVAAGLEPLTLGHGKFNPRNLTSLLRLMKQARVDLLHAHGFGACMWARLAGKIAGVPVIVHGRCNYGTVPPFMRPVERVLGPGTRLAFAVSESTRQYTIHKRHIPADRVRVLYNGIPPGRVTPAPPAWIESTRRELGAEQKMIVGVVGRLEPYKGLLDACEAIRALDDPRAVLWVVGDGSFESTLRARIQDHDLGDRVKLLGYRRDVAHLIQCFDLQLFPSHQEGTPNTLFEAIAAGNALVASTCDGQGEILEDGVTAELFSPGDVESMARGLKRLLDDPDLLHQRREAARELAQRFDGRHTVATMEAAYDELLSRPHRPRFRHRVEHAFTRLLRFPFRVLPHRASLNLGAGLALAAHQVFGWRREETQRRIQQVLPEKTPAEQKRIRREAVRNLGRNVAELYRADLLDEAWFQQNVEPGNAFETVEKAREAGKGVVVVVCHAGNWDLAGTYGCKKGLPTCFIARAQKNPLTYNTLVKARTQNGGTVMDRDDPGLFRKLLAFLKNNGVVVILVDIRARGEGEFFQFLGHPCRMSNGLGLLAAKSGAEIVPLFLHREKHKHVWKAFPPRRIPSGAPKPERHELLQSCLDILGEEVRLHPESYFWFNKRWVLEI